MERAYWIILSYVSVKQETQDRILRYVITLSLAGVFIISAVVNITNAGGRLKKKYTFSRIRNDKSYIITLLDWSGD